MLVLGASLNYAVTRATAPSYVIINFDYTRAYGDMANLTAGGPRMAGTAAEHNGANYIASKFREAGLKSVEIKTYDILLFEVKKAEVSLVEYGLLGKVPKRWDTKAVTPFQHTVDFVVQGYSGSRPWSDFRDDLEMYDMGNGTDDSEWDAAAGKAGIVNQEIGVGSNTVLFFKARDHGLKALILHNTRFGEQLGYLPIFKSTGLPANETAYPDIPFFMAGKAVGEKMLAAVGTSRLRLDFDVVRETRPIMVVTADVPGTSGSKDFVMLGGHHDTVYDGPGAVDNTSGSAVVLEMARQLVAARPKLTIKFATWGGEEEGLFGSTAWVREHSDTVNSSLIHYLNFDMPHVNTPRGMNFTFMTNDNTTAQHYRELVRMAKEENRALAKYSIAVAPSQTLAGNSDHAPFMALGKKVSFAAGSGSYEYHTYRDDMTQVFPESLAVGGVIGGSYALYLANGGK